MTTTQTLTDVLGFVLFIYYYVKAGGFNPLQLVLAGTALEATALICEVPTGVLADNYSRRLSIIIGTSLMGLSTLGQSIAPDFGLVMVCQAVRGLAYAFIGGADKAWLADEAGEEAVGPTLLLGSQLGQLISVVGILGNVGLSLIDLRLPFLASGLISLGMTVFLIVAMPERGFTRPTRQSHGGLLATFRAGLGVVRFRPLLILFMVIEFFVGAASEGYDRLWESHLLTNFQFPTLWDWSPIIWFGLVNLGGQLLSFGALQLTRNRLDITNRRRVAQVLLVTQGLSLLACFGVGLAGSFELVVAAAWLRGVITTVTHPLFQTWLTLSIPARVRATVLSMSNQVNAFGEVLGGPGIGALGNAFGTRLAIVSSGFFLLPNLFLYARLAAYSQPDEDDLAVTAQAAE